MADKPVTGKSRGRTSHGRTALFRKSHGRKTVRPVAARAACNPDRYAETVGNQCEQNAEEVLKMVPV